MITVAQLDALLAGKNKIKCTGTNCTRRNFFSVHYRDPVQVSTRCRCGLGRNYFPCDQEGEADALRVALGVQVQPWSQTGIQNPV